jgi:hypothetical protein
MKEGQRTRPFSSKRAVVYLLHVGTPSSVDGEIVQSTFPLQLSFTIVPSQQRVFPDALSTKEAVETGQVVIRKSKSVLVNPSDSAEPTVNPTGEHHAIHAKSVKKSITANQATDIFIPLPDALEYH